MSVVKAFDLDDAKEKKVDQAIDESYEKNSVLERAVNPYVAAQQIILNHAAWPSCSRQSRFI